MMSSMNWMMVTNRSEDGSSSRVLGLLAPVSAASFRVFIPHDQSLMARDSGFAWVFKPHLRWY